MAPEGSRPRRFPCRNPSPLDPVEDELTKEPGPVGGPHSGSTSPALSRNPIPGSKLVPTLNPAPIPAPAPPSSNKLFKKFIKTYLESNQESRQSPKERKQSFKVKIPEVYYNKLHMDCYHFCQQCKNHFKTVGATGFNRTLFSASFFHGNISVHWTQFKRRNRSQELTSIT